jgi:hypothetical protein
MLRRVRKCRMHCVAALTLKGMVACLLDEACDCEVGFIVCACLALQLGPELLMGLQEQH